MRTIKFRAWDRQHNRWARIACLQLMSNGGTFYEFTQLGKERFDYQQFTGCVDINDKEIYEGDIVTLQYANYPFPSGKFEIIFERGSFLLKKIVIDGLAGISFSKGKYLHIDEDGEHVYKEDPDEKITKPIGDFNIIEVIGNTYENADLLLHK